MPSLALTVLLALSAGTAELPSLTEELELRLQEASPESAAARSEPRLGHLALLWGGFALDEPEHFWEFGGEWRLPELGAGIGPIAGLSFFEGGSTYTYAGLRWEVDLGRDLFLAPSFAAGLYDENDGFALGGPLEFRSALELGWHWHRASSLSLTYYHLSNASLYEENGGSESLVLSLGLDLTELWR